MEINNLFLNEHHIYSPNELYFSVDDSGLEDFSGVKYVVYFTTIDCFEKEKCQSDNLGGHNIDNKSLLLSGLCDVELMESIFEVDYGNSIEEVTKNLLNNGFKFSSEFDKFIKKNN